MVLVLSGKMGAFWVSAKNGFGSCLQCKKWESRDGFRKLGISDFYFVVYSYDLQSLLLFFSYYV